MPAAIIKGSSMSMRVMSAVVRESALSTIAPSRHSPPRMPGIPIQNISQTIRMSPAIRQMRAGVLHPYNIIHYRVHGITSNHIISLYIV